MKFQKMKVTSYFHFSDNMLVITYLHIEWRNKMGKLTAREKVMEAATLLFGEKGYTATTIREVAEKQE